MNAADTNIAVIGWDGTDRSTKKDSVFATANTLLKINVPVEQTQKLKRVLERAGFEDIVISRGRGYAFRRCGDHARAVKLLREAKLPPAVTLWLTGITEIQRQKTEVITGPNYE